MNASNAPTSGPAGADDNLRSGVLTALGTAMKPALPEPADSMVDSAYQQIRRLILDNAWPPGYRALEREVAAVLDMSRTPVHEALARLQGEGLVEVISRQGMRVLPVSPNDMREIYEILTALECMAAERLASRKPSDKELKPLVDATKAMDRALNAGDLQAWAAADERFHSQLVHLAGNRQMQATVLNYWDRAHRARMFTLHLRPKPVNSTKEHIQMVERLRAGDADGAAAVTRAHRQRASSELLAIFERFKVAQI
jgi:DNA-binding GntR family transcriptional regulator